MTLPDINIQGRVTRYTRQFSSRSMYSSDLSESVLKELKTDGSFTCKVNGRECLLEKTGYYFYVTVQDKPAPHKISRKTVIMANAVFMAFCKSRDFKILLNGYEASRKFGFRETLLTLLEEIKTPQNCSECTKRFACFTERNG